MAKGVVKREVVRVITPGTVTAVEALDARGNNFLAAVFKGTARLRSGVDRYHHRRVSLYRDRRGRGAARRAGRGFSRAKSCWRAVTLGSRERLYKEYPSIHFTRLADEQFGDSAGSRVAPEFADRLNNYAGGIACRVGDLAYLQANAADSFKLLRDLELYAVANYLVLDDTTRANLELVANYQGDRKGSLLAIVDRTVTPIGARRLRQLAALSIA